MPTRVPGSREEDAWLSDEQLAKYAQSKYGQRRRNKT